VPLPTASALGIPLVPPGFFHVPSLLEVAPPSPLLGNLMPMPLGGPPVVLGSAPPVVLGAPEVPTEGSRGHGFGACKPCAFVFKGGCTNGVQCQFCHLCPPGEKKQRKKDWKEARKAVVQAPGFF
jgi:hypothetical protein